MSYSIGEIAALSRRAVRGAGYPWGIADEAAWAVSWLQRAGLPGADALASGLADEEFSAFGEAVAYADRCETPGSLRPSEQMLMLPFLALATPVGKALHYAADGLSFRIWADGCDKPLPVDRLAFTGHVAAPSDCRSGRAVVSQTGYRFLKELAARTYAPSTAESRMRGAGAGLTDND